MIYLRIAAALAILGLLWGAVHVWNKAQRLEAENKQLNATLLAERENTRKANESAKRYAARLQQSRGPRSPPPVLMCRLPAAVPTATTTSRVDAASAPDNPGVPEEVDIGPRIDVPFRACEENLIKLEELQRWVRSR